MYIQLTNKPKKEFFMKKILLLVFVLIGQNAFAGFDIKCDVGGAWVLAENYAILPQIHGDSGTVLNQFRIYNFALDKSFTQNLNAASYTINQQGLILNINSLDGGEMVVTIPGLTQWTPGVIFNNATADIRLNIDGVAINKTDVACHTAFLNNF